MKSASRHVVLSALAFLVGLSAVVPGRAAAQTSKPREISPRITRLEAWLSAVDQHTPGALDEPVRLIGSWSREDLRLIWIDVSTLVSLVRQPDVDLFFISEGTRPSVRNPPPRAPRQVLYTVAELRRLHAIAEDITSVGTVGPENDLLKRAAMLHADIAILLPPGSMPARDDGRPGPGGVMLYMNDGQQVGFQDNVSHWDMGRRLLDRVRSPDSKTLKGSSDPAGDSVVRLWYQASCTFMLNVNRIDPAHFDRALELFPEDPELLFIAGAIHEMFSGARTQGAMRSMRVPRGVIFDVQSEDQELRRAQQLYKKAIKGDPTLTEARVRLGRVLTRRGRAEEAAGHLRDALPRTTEPVLEYYAALFLGDVSEALGNDDEARRSYQRAATLYPNAQSPLLGLSRVAEQGRDRRAAGEAIQRVLKLPVEETERPDPWWNYETAAARRVDFVLSELRKRMSRTPPR